jgi:Actinobacteria/chloroflexi VLRF1 release factor
VPASGARRIVEVPPERLARWCTGFGERHGGVLSTYKSPKLWTLTAVDGVDATLEPPFPPLAVQPDEHPGLAIAELLDHALTDRVVGVLLVRLGGHAAGIFEGTRLVSSKVDRALVHGRSKAGGWSQQRFARRRAGQARESLADAADTAARILLPEIGRLDAVVLGGDRRAVDQLRSDRRLSPVFALAIERFLTVPEPRLAVLQDTPHQFRSVRVVITEP